MSDDQITPQAGQPATIEFTPDEMAAAESAEEIACLRAANADLQHRAVMLRALVNRQGRQLAVAHKALEDAIRDRGPSLDGDE